MHLTFGIYLDGANWSSSEASSGEVKLGPFGMLSLLETRLGLTGLTVHPAERINQYMQRLKASDNSDSWFHDSLSADAWSTAKQMLSWRDKLIEAGWKGQADQSCSPRLQALKQLEESPLTLSPGREDRLREVICRLESPHSIKSIDISHITLQEPLELLPPVWQKIFTQLQAIGAIVKPAALVRHRRRSSNLASIQSILIEESSHKSLSKKDDCLLMVRAADEWEAADNLALWLASDRSANRDVTIICDSDTDILDQALQRHGLPMLGGSGFSRWRATLQILPLVLANAWKPVDVHRLAELLSLISAPVARFAATYLLNALGQEPGIGGVAWEKALNEIRTDREDHLSKKGSENPKEEAAAYTARLNAFLNTDRYSPDEGIPEDKLKERCRWVVEWLSWQIDSDPLIVEAISHAHEMEKLAEGKGNIPRVAVERMLDSIIGVGSSSPDRDEQAADWNVVSHPGQVTDPCSTIIWWGFIDPEIKPATYWSESERSSLNKFGTEIENTITPRSREARAWKLGIMNAETHLLMFYSEHMHGETIYPHPLWDEIRNAALKIDPDLQDDDLSAYIMRECDKLNNKGSWRLAGRTASLEKTEESEPELLVAAHKIPKDTISRPASLSYSQMGTIIGCPMKWVLQYHSRLRVPETMSLPTGNQMIGNLCHRIVQEIYTGPSRQCTPAEAETEALKLYDSLVVSMASELLLEGNELENKRYRQDVAHAVRQLVEAISRLGLTVEKSEEKLEADMSGIPFVGYADLLLRDKKDNPFVLDLKWSGSSRYKKEEVEEGAALQLASYAWMLEAKSPDSSVQSGYFMLAQGKLLSDSTLLGEEALSSEHSLRETLDMGTKSLNNRLDSLTKGQLEASGIHEKLIQEEEGLSDYKLRKELKAKHQAQGLLYQQPYCKFCDFTVLCGIGGGS